MRFGALVRLVAAVAAAPLLAQQYTFDVASIKPSNPAPADRNSSGFNSRGNGLRATNTSLYQLIRMALGAQEFQLRGGPAWIKDARFDINAKNDVAEPDSPDSDRNGQQAQLARFRSRVKNLLAERFKLVLREETRELPMYALTVDKAAPKLTLVVEPKRHISSDSGELGGNFNAEGIRMEDLCDFLAGVLERPVVDETGLDGFYDIVFKYALDKAAGGRQGDGLDVTGPSIFTVMRETLGLRLVSKKGPVKAWVIESAEKPGEN